MSDPTVQPPPDHVTPDPMPAESAWPREPYSRIQEAAQKKYADVVDALCHGQTPDIQTVAAVLVLNTKTMQQLEMDARAHYRELTTPHGPIICPNCKTVLVGDAMLENQVVNCHKCHQSFAAKA